ncbi:hypothetical protein LTR27_002460 [Elasticomyces elasticus]|nr:hypothetical protein LTR27_002460 [Elasticomyces elasticus]
MLVRSAAALLLLLFAACVSSARTALTPWGWSKYRIWIDTYTDAACGHRMQKPYFLYSRKDCKTFSKPFSSFHYLYEQKRFDDFPEQRMCTLFVFEGPECTERHYGINATSWLNTCVTKEGEVESYDGRSVKLDCFGGNKFDDDDTEASPDDSLAEDFGDGPKDWLEDAAEH